MGKHVLSFLSMKAWHPATHKNQDKKQKAEQEYVKAKKAQEQYAKQYRQEMAELEEKRQLEREKEWQRQQVLNREKERKAYLQNVEQKTSEVTSNEASTEASSGKKARRGRRKKKNPAVKSTGGIASTLQAMAKQTHPDSLHHKLAASSSTSMDFMYVAPPGLKEAQEKEEQLRAQKEREHEDKYEKERKEQERRIKKEENDAMLKAQEDVIAGGATALPSGGILLQCGTCGMFGHSTGSEKCPNSAMARVKRER